MKGLIVAAGKGTRLGNITKAQNKCAIEVEGVPIIRRITNSFVNNGINDIYVITGFAEDTIQNAVSDTANCLYNPLYDTTGILVSLLRGKKEVEDHNFIFSTGDNVFDPSVLPGFLSADGDIVVAVRKKQCVPGDMRVHATEGKILRLDTDILDEHSVGEFGMMVKLSPKGGTALFYKAEEVLKTTVKARFVDTLNKLSNEGFSIVPYYIEENQGIEVDTKEDLSVAHERAKNF